MGVDVTTLTEPADWNALVDASPHTTPFHRYESLRVIADHTNATLHPYVGFKGQEAVGLFPVFELAKGPLSTAFSPPPDLEISYLGPALVNHEKQKRRRQQRTNRQFVEECLRRVDAEIDPKFTFVRTAFRYVDARPFVWTHHEPTTRYTYVVDLRRSEEEILASFSADARRNVRRTDEADYEVYVGGEAEVERTIELTKARHDEQGVTYNVTPEFAVDLHRELPDDACTVYGCEVDGEFVGGHITLRQGAVAYRWQSWGNRNNCVPVNDLLDWTIMRSVRERGAEWYDLVGANNPRISKYKSKFGPTLRTYQRVQKGTRGMKVVSELYKRVR